MKSKRKTGSFLQTASEILNEIAFSDILSWTDTGASFVIFDIPRFTSEVLPKFFKHQNFSSFNRQLNLYGFYKIPGAKYPEYKHPLFLKDRPDLIAQIHRKVKEPSHGLIPKIEEGSVSALVEMLVNLCKVNQKAELQIQALTEQIDLLLKENDSLTQDIIETKQKTDCFEKALFALVNYLQKGKLSFGNINAFEACVSGTQRPQLELVANDDEDWTRLLES